MAVSSSEPFLSDFLTMESLRAWRRNRFAQRVRCIQDIVNNPDLLDYLKLIDVADALQNFQEEGNAGDELARILQGPNASNAAEEFARSERIAQLRLRLMLLDCMYTTDSSGLEADQPT